MTPFFAVPIIGLGQPTLAADDGDPTTVVPAPTAAAPELAWSLSEDDGTYAPRTRRAGQPGRPPAPESAGYRAGGDGNNRAGAVGRHGVPLVGGMAVVLTAVVLAVPEPMTPQATRLPASPVAIVSWSGPGVPFFWV